jgi:hypothetical protein
VPMRATVLGSDFRLRDGSSTSMAAGSPRNRALGGFEMELLVPSRRSLSQHSGRYGPECKTAKQRYCPEAAPPAGRTGISHLPVAVAAVSDSQAAAVWCWPR